MVRTSYCPSCERELPLGLFYLRGDTGKPRVYCKKCIADKARERNKTDKAKEANRQRSRKHILKSYGMTEEEFDTLLSSQNSQCKICKTDLIPTGTREELVKIACVDHCHNTGKVRGILCRKCNSGIGYFKDNPDLVGQAVSYLSGAL